MEVEQAQVHDSNVSHSKEMDRLIKLAQRYECGIGIECESVLSKSFRASDPIRDEVVEVVRKQTQLAWESIKNVFEQARVEVVQATGTVGPQLVEEGVFQILRVAGLTSTAQLEQCLDETMNLRTKMGTLCNRLGCTTETIEECVSDMRGTLAEKEMMIRSLRSELEAEKLQNRKGKRSAWLRLSTVFAAQARQGTKVISVCGPRGEQAWERNRNKTIEMFKIMREAAAASGHNIVTMFGQTPAFTEPCVTMGSAPRMTPDEAYSVQLIKQFLVALQEYVAGHIHHDLFVVFPEPIDRTKFYKYKKRMDPEQAREVLRSVGMTRRKFSQERGDDDRFAHTSKGDGRFGYGHHRGPDNHRGKRPRGRWIFKPY
ncbi:hypothetical protein Aduo_016619 [Ancylostoma duodenale]